jgi:hypothetical protein
MKHPILKITVSNIISLWFGADTPIRQYKILMNPELWTVCQRVHQRFTPPSGVSSTGPYHHSDRIAFAKAVAQEMTQEPVYFL